MVPGSTHWASIEGEVGVRAIGLGTLLIALLAVPALLDESSGVGIWLELQEDLVRSTARLDELVVQNESLRREIELLEDDPTAMDRVIREELDLALPGEVVVRFVPVEPAR
jgi:cell division protein FtsB